MWQKIITILGGLLIDKLLAALTKAAQALLSKTKETAQKLKRKAISKKKIKEHKDAKTKDEQRDSFNRLP